MNRKVLFSVEHDHEEAHGKLEVGRCAWGNVLYINGEETESVVVDFYPSSLSAGMGGYDEGYYDHFDMQFIFYDPDNPFGDPALKLRRTVDGRWEVVLPPRGGPKVVREEM